MDPSHPILEYGTTQRATPAQIGRFIAIHGVLLAIGLCLGFTVGFLIRPEPVYRASSMLQISSVPYGTPLASGTRALDPAEIPAVGEKIRQALNATTYRQRIVDDLRFKLLPTAPQNVDQLSQHLTISYLKDTILFRIDATDPNPAAASEIANIAARQAVQEFRGQAPSVDLAARAYIPFAPSNNPKMFVYLSSLIGGIILPVAAWLFMRTRSKSTNSG
jgi:uncharacterized protein involved in exopolysaccharide biosynthesis